MYINVICISIWRKWVLHFSQDMNIVLRNAKEVDQKNDADDRYNAYQVIIEECILNSGSLWVHV